MHWNKFYGTWPLCIFVSFKTLCLSLTLRKCKFKIEAVKNENLADLLSFSKIILSKFNLSNVIRALTKVITWRFFCLFQSWLGDRPNTGHTSLDWKEDRFLSVAINRKRLEKKLTNSDCPSTQLDPSWTTLPKSLQYFFSS